ncbi:glycosyl hydrolase [Aureococcus anophagefferens]|nr:glycosyl hydrolase [Aureococcus anophagefferens]
MVGKSLLALLLLPLCAAKQDRQPDDDDRTIWVSNGTGVPGELFVGLLNTGRKGQAHRIEVRFDALGLDGAAYDVFDASAGMRPLAHPRDTFGANVVPEQAAATDAGAAIAALQTWYDEKTGLWDLAPEGAQWWNSANCLELVCNYVIHENGAADDLLAVINATFSLTTLEETLTGRYDDEGWWCLALVRAYEAAGDAAYLDRAAKIFADLAVHAWDDACGGGVWWSYAKSYKNAITNELFFAMAMKLHGAAGPDVVVAGRTYLDWGRATWAWFERSGLVNGADLVNDGLVSSGADPSCANNGQQVWSYNQGVVLGGLADLYKETRNSTLLDAGLAIATAATEALAWNGTSILAESCDGPDLNGCDLDQEQFKGIFARYVMYFALTLEGSTMGAYAAGARDLRAWAATNAAAIWGDDRDASDLSELWAGPFAAAGRRGAPS